MRQAPPPLQKINPGNLTRGAVTEQPRSRPKPPNGVKLISARATVRTLHLPLGRTVLCLDCETCFEIGADRGPVCGSGTWASVARFLHGGHDPSRTSWSPFGFRPAMMPSRPVPLL